MPDSLERLSAKIKACRICLEAPQGRALPHEPRPVFQVSSTAKLLIVGQAPGTRVHASGRPFTDPSGVRLRQWLGIDETLFYDERRVAIVPMGFCFPGQDEKGADLPPRRECAPAWRAKLLAHLTAVRLVICLRQSFRGLRRRRGRRGLCRHVHAAQATRAGVFRASL